MEMAAEQKKYAIGQLFLAATVVLAAVRWKGRVHPRAAPKHHAAGDSFLVEEMPVELIIAAGGHAQDMGQGQVQEGGFLVRILSALCSDRPYLYLQLFTNQGLRSTACLVQTVSAWTGLIVVSIDAS